MAIGTGAALLGAGLGGALIGSRGSRRAADTMAGSADAATAEQRRQFDIATGLAQPGIDAGNTARDQLLRLLGIGDGTGGDPTEVIQQAPGFQFQLEQGRRALNANRSAGGVSGGELFKDFARFNQGTASSFYQDYANRLQDIATGGNNAALNQGALGVQTGANIGNTLQNAGNARASGILGQHNAFGGLLQQLGQFIGAGLFNFGGGGGLGGSSPGGGLGR